METPLNEGFVLAILRMAETGCAKAEIVENCRMAWSAQVKQKDIGKHIAEAKRRGMYSVPGMAFGDTYYQYEPDKALTSSVKDPVKEPSEITLDQAKELFAGQFGKTWTQVRADMFYGVGVADSYDWDEIIDRIAEIYKTGKL